MTIGVSDGTQYESQFEMYAAPYQTASAEQKEAPAIDRIEQNKEILNPVRNVPSNTPIDLHQDNREQRGSHQWFKDQNKRDYTDSTMPVGAPEKPAGAFNIERGYNVPLAASALTHDGESMYGVAVDHRIPSSHTFETGDKDRPGHTYDPAQFVALHEGAELPHMANLITGGQSAQDAYHEAHDKIATPTETAAVRAYAVKNNLNPDHFMDDYKQFWRDGAAMASEPSDKPRHPDAHTTKYGLDESESGYKVAGDLKDLKPNEQDEALGEASRNKITGWDPEVNDSEALKDTVDKAGSVRIWDKSPAAEKLLKDYPDDYERLDVHEFNGKYDHEFSGETTIIRRKNSPALVS